MCKSIQIQYLILMTSSIFMGLYRWFAKIMNRNQQQ